MPRRAAVEMAPMMATGIAMISGHGVATTTTLRNRSGCPDHHQAAAGQRQRHRRVHRTELIPDTAQGRTPLLGVAHHPHDAGET